MDYKKANRAYLYMILSTLALVLILTAWVFTTGRLFSIAANNILSELVVLVPAIATILYHGDRLGVLIPFKRIKISSAIPTIVLSTKSIETELIKVTSGKRSTTYNTVSSADDIFIRLKGITTLNLSPL